MLLELLQCENPGKYRKKMAGLVLPFNTKEKRGRILPDDPSWKYKYKAEKSAEEIRAGMEQVRLVRQEAQLRKEREEKDKYLRNRQVLERIREQQLQERGLANEAPPKSQRPGPKREKVVVKPGKNQPLTLELLENLNYNDINQGGLGDDFKPADVLEDEEVNEPVLLGRRAKKAQRDAAIHGTVSAVKGYNKPKGKDCHWESIEREDNIRAPQSKSLVHQRPKPVLESDSGMPKLMAYSDGS